MFAAISQEVMDAAWTQYPAVAIVVFLTIAFLAHISRDAKRNQEDRKQIQTTFTDALRQDRQEMKPSMDRLGNRLDTTSKLFAKTMSETAEQQAMIQSKVIDALARIQSGDK